MPDALRTYADIADHYRRQIYGGELASGTRLPSNKAMASQHGVAVTTIQRALGQLASENLIRTSPRGTFVSDAPSVGSSGRDRLARATRLRGILMEGETVEITSASIVRPPSYVGDIFDLEDGDQVVRREYITARGSVRLSFGVNWYPASFAALVPDLLSTAPAKHDDLLMRILEVTGRTLTVGRDDQHARTADQREANGLGIAVGTAILAGATRLGDDEGIIEYGEWCLPPRLTIGYEYHP
ncbi:GntR family transcriptional regulator [Streptantibioticus rubrisoli]|uniref:GntR family transcriptional regulator n=1 Tax=Streptantibioticus rubrisoli TaxID=1387313 RepID=A0ABT1PFW1_9ACTN|nr:GntR family transcriptional regulator [Streptantibioticus rubrisoli]MCQ4043368.1 GntR family transcriptional regulator [Streptantibioticus rubrisoli]